MSVALGGSWAVIHQEGSPPSIVVASDPCLLSHWLADAPDGLRQILSAEDPRVHAAFLKGDFLRLDPSTLQPGPPTHDDMACVLKAYLLDLDCRMEAEAEVAQEEKQACRDSIERNGWQLMEVSASYAARINAISNGHGGGKPINLRPLMVMRPGAQDPRMDDPCFPSAEFGEPGSVATLWEYMQAEAFSRYMNWMIRQNGDALGQS